MDLVRACELVGDVIKRYYRDGEFGMFEVSLLEAAVELMGDDVKQAEGESEIK